MFKYNKQINSVVEEEEKPFASKAEARKYRHYKPRRTLPVSGEVDWLDGQDREEGKDFKAVKAGLYYGPAIKHTSFNGNETIAIPLTSKL